MSSQKKSTCSNGLPDTGESIARMHCLESYFPFWTGNDHFFLEQIKESIEATLADENRDDTFENFVECAERLRRQTPGTMPPSHAFISIDFSNRTWDPLFASEEIASVLKQHAGIENVFLLIRGLQRALFPAARYQTRSRKAAYQEATRLMDELAGKWSTQSSIVHLLYV